MKEERNRFCAKLELSYGIDSIEEAAEDYKSCWP